MLTKDQILAASDLPTEEVPVPEWGGSVFIRSMTGVERDSLEQSILDGKNNNTGLVKCRARIAVRVVCDKDGKRLFTDEDAEKLGAKSGKALDRVFDAAQRLSGIGAKDIKDLQGN